MSKAISIRLPDRLTRALEQLASATERTKTHLIRKAIETYLGEYADYQIALDRLRDKDDKILASKDLKDSLGI